VEKVHIVGFLAAVDRHLLDPALTSDGFL
jgi:hypothetical protein